MAEGGQEQMAFVPMTSIGKTVDDWDEKCTDWVATEKVHGSSFQFYTDDGRTIHAGSRRRNLDGEGSFLKCDIQDFVKAYEECVLAVWKVILYDDVWREYRENVAIGRREDTVIKPRRTREGSSDDMSTRLAGEFSELLNEKMAEGNEGRSIVSEDSVSNATCKDGDSWDCGSKEQNIRESTENLTDKCSLSKRNGGRVSGDSVNNDFGESDGIVNNDSAENDNSSFQLRLYGELYGGGGVSRDTTRAIQKEIIYCDDYRFYVFGLTINRKWVTIAELGALCEQAGFPYYAKPVNGEPTKTVDELKGWLEDSGLMTSRSALTDRQDDRNTRVEGFVITPLTKTDHRLHAVKYLSSAFNDVRTQQKPNKKVKTIYCTKQRYHSVISKLDDDERRDKDAVADMMIADIIAESQVPDPSKKQRKAWRKATLQWLREDGYITLEEEKG